MNNNGVTSVAALKSNGEHNGKKTPMLEHTTNYEVKSLQNQLKRMDSCRQSYQMCLEEVLQFLRQAYHNLEMLADKLKSNNVILSCYDNSRSPSLPMSSTTLELHHNNTIQKSKPIKFSADELSPEMLSNEVQSFIRIINNTLNAAKETRSIEEQNQFLDSLRREFGPRMPLESSSPNRPQNKEVPIAAENSLRISSNQNYRNLPNSRSPSNSNEIESGFSSLSSFHERKNSMSLLRDLTAIEKIRNSTIVSKKGEIYV